MLSEQAIDNLIKPLVDRQEAINLYIVQLIAKRIKEIGELKPSDIHRLQRLMRMGADVQQVNAELARLTNLQVTDIKRLIRTVALDGYLMARPYYDYRMRPFIPFNKNYELQNIVKAIENRTIGTFMNMSNSSGFMLRDLAHPQRLIPTPLAKTFQTVMDEAVQMVQSGVTDFGSAMRRTLKQLNNSGLRYITYNTPSGKVYTQRLDTAMRRNLLDGVGAIQQEVQNEIGRQIGSDGKEISVHQYSALDHEPVQGHQFTNEEYEKLQNSLPFKDVDGKSFAAIDRHIGQYNCRHFTWAIILGVDKPNFTKQQLQDLIDKNHAGYTTSDGKHMTMYECLQKMREMETAIRRAKDGKMMAEAAGDYDLARQYRAQASQLSKEYKAFCKECGIAPDMGRCAVPGYSTKIVES